MRNFRVSEPEIALERDLVPRAGGRFGDSSGVTSLLALLIGDFDPVFACAGDTIGAEG